MTEDVLIFDAETDMNDDEKWILLQKAAEHRAKEAMLSALLEATGLGEYIAKRIAEHELTTHGDH